MSFRNRRWTLKRCVSAPLLTIAVFLLGIPAQAFCCDMPGSCCPGGMESQAPDQPRLSSSDPGCCQPVLQSDASPKSLKPATTTGTPTPGVLPSTTVLADGAREGTRAQATRHDDLPAPPGSGIKDRAPPRS